VHALDTFRVDAWQQLEGTPLLFIFFHGDFDECTLVTAPPKKKALKTGREIKTRATTQHQ